MQLFTIIAFLFASASALAGQLSNVQNQRLQFDLAEKMEHRRMILATMRKINRMPLWRREMAMRGLQQIARELQAAYESELTPVQQKQNYRRNRLAKYHS